MRVLHTVEFYSPSVGGAQEVVRQISERLAKWGHEVTVATTKLPQRTTSTLNGVNIAEFAVSGNAVRGFRGEVKRYQDFLVHGQFDVMMNYAAQQWATDLVFPVIDRIPYRKTLAPCGFSGLLSPQYAGYFERMPHVLGRYDYIILHSATYRDAEFMRKHDIGHRGVIPNGASVEEFSRVDSTFRERYGIPNDRPMLLTVGGHTGQKGHSLTIRAFRRAKIGPSVLVVIGNMPYEEGCLPNCRRQAALTSLLTRGQKKVLLLDPPRPDVVAAYHAADLFVFCSSMECSPIVLFEAMASRTPFLTLSSGNAAEIVQWGQGGMVMPGVQCPNGHTTAEESTIAHAIEEIMSDPEKSSHLAQAGYDAWRQRFTWENIATQYEDLYQSLTSSRQ